MPPRRHPLFERLAALARAGPVVTAHRGDSAHHPENTLPAFRAARDLGVAMQEFDVRRTYDGHLICIHDASFDRTTDAARRLGPGALVAETSLARARELDTGGREPIPTLEEALAVMLPDSIPLIEHKAGEASDYVAELRRIGCLASCILQSFDWRFVAAASELAPELALAVLGPWRDVEAPTEQVLTRAATIGAGMVHWRDRALRSDDVRRIHARGLLVCTYTTDDELGMRGGAAMGIDAMCTNDPARMLGLLGDACSVPRGAQTPR